MTDLMNSIAGVDLGLAPGLTKNTGVPTTDALMASAIGPSAGMPRSCT